MTLISYLTRTQFADGAIEDALPEEVRGLERIVVLADGEPGAREAVRRVRGALPRVALTVLERTPAAPGRRSAAALVENLSRAGALALVPIGGGQAVAEARLAAEIALRQGASCPVVAIPTALFDFGLAPDVRPADGDPVACPRPRTIIADPTCLAPVPTRRLAAAGMALLVHAMEAYARPTFNPPADGLALDAVRRLAVALPALARGPADADLRRELMAAALITGLAMEKGVGGVDALAHPLEEDLAGAVLPGELHAPLLVAFVEFNARAVGARYPALLDAMGEHGAEQNLSARIADLARKLGLPAALRETATDRRIFDRLATRAADDPATLANPRLMTPADCQHILEAAW